MLSKKVVEKIGYKRTQSYISYARNESNNYVISWNLHNIKKNILSKSLGFCFFKTPIVCPLTQSIVGNALISASFQSVASTILICKSLSKTVVGYGVPFHRCRRYITTFRIVKIATTKPRIDNIFTPSLLLGLRDLLVRLAPK